MKGKIQEIRTNGRENNGENPLSREDQEDCVSERKWSKCGAIYNGILRSPQLFPCDLYNVRLMHPESTYYYIIYICKYIMRY